MALPVFDHLLGFFLGDFSLFLGTSFFFFEAFYAVFHYLVLYLSVFEVVVAVEHQGAVLVDASFGESGERHHD